MYKGIAPSCVDVNECELVRDICGEINEICVNTDGSFICSCKTGYARVGKSCADINECDIGTHTCGRHQECSNTDGSFTCDTKGRFLHFLFTIIRNFL